MSVDGTDEGSGGAAIAGAGVGAICGESRIEI